MSYSKTAFEPLEKSSDVRLPVSTFVRLFAAHLPAAVHQEQALTWTLPAGMAVCGPSGYAGRGTGCRAGRNAACPPVHTSEQPEVLKCAWLVSQGEAVVDVVASTEGRLLVLTEAHVALLRSKAIALRAAYTAAWAVRLTEIQTIRGVLRFRFRFIISCRLNLNPPSRCAPRTPPPGPCG